uniref:Uncharacterized protein n=2 Tax=Odontella aurita TaxID=265563 RepID=A0A7S4MHV8_9STRA|mmetsp:Transcript_2185/g.5810  ORF Transcript_2185/g.5810 Transcript_2185/m.5810 type:complete len:106 (+) Transcript_2185:483-800(+)
MEEETPEESRRRRSGVVFVAVAAAFSIIGMGFPQFAKWWRKRNERLDGDGFPAAEVTLTGAGNMDPDGASISISSVSVSEVDTVSVLGDSPVVPPPPPSASDVLV